VDLPRGGFLAGFALRDSVEFDEWQLAASEQVRRDVASALERLTAAFEDDDVDQAIAYARRWVELDPLQEGAHRALIRLHARKGDRAAAARQYRQCVALLERELGVTPGAETTEAFEQSTAAPERAGSPNLHELVGDLLTLQGRYGEAEVSYHTALALGAPSASVRRKQGDLQQRLGDYARADELYGEALDAAPVDERARVLADRSLNAHRWGKSDVAEELAARALEAAGDDRALAQAHNLAGILATHRGDLGVSRGHLESSLELSEKLGDPAATVAALNNLALALKGTEIESALRFAQRALDLCARVGDRHREAAMHSNLADLLRIAGRDEQARAHLRTSAAIFAEVGEPDELQPEIWKLVEW
jgi:tetratricopeptide (TPR) repeat protein